MNALAQVDDWPVPAVGVAVVGTDGVIDTRGSTTHAMRLASVTKLFSAYAVAIAVEEGAVHLDDPAGPAGATLRHLLAHTAGYGFESSAPVLAPPGTRRIYSNRGIEEATAHLEERSGIAFSDYLAEAVLAPLGLGRTELRGSSAEGLWSTVDDLMLFAAELLAPRLLSATGLAEMVHVQFPGLAGVLPGHGRFDPLDWGLGVERNFGRPRHWGGTAISSAAFGHFGGSGTFLWVDPSTGLACACLTARDFDLWAREAWPRLSDAIVTEYGARTSPSTTTPG